MTVLNKFGMTRIENSLRHYSRYCITDAEIAILLDSTPDSRYSRVKRLLAKHKLLRLRRGLYGLGEELGYTGKPHPFELSQFIYAPSYISLESALAYHKLIPEAVYTVTCVCTKRSKEFKTPLGIFNYFHLPVENFYMEVEIISENNYRFFMAKIWKAICDYVYCYKKEWRNIKPLSESLRISIEELPPLNDEEAENLMSYYHQHRLDNFIKGIKRDLS